MTLIGYIKDQARSSVHINMQSLQFFNLLERHQVTRWS